MKEVESFGSSDDHLLVDMGTMLGNSLAGVDVVDSGDSVVPIQLISSSQQRTRIW